MSIKFFSGLQDLLGLYDASVATTSHPSAHIPSSSSLFSSISADPGPTAHRRKSAGEYNHTLTVSDDVEQIRKCSHERKVHFDDEHLISGYFEASAPIFSSQDAKNEFSSGELDVDSMLSSYQRVCQTLGIATITAVERQIERLPRTSCSRQEVFSVKGERISASQMEALEEIFRRVQFDSLDFEYTFLDDDAAIALSEMLEFYESAHKLNLSFNKQITVRGWTDVFRAVKNSNSLQMLNLRYTSLSEKSLSALCRVLRGTPQPALSCLHLENVNLYGKNLYTLVCALKFNTVLKELYLGENTLQSGDGAHLYQLIMNNTAIQMLDLRNNSLSDVGIVKICEALRNPEVVKKTSLTALVLWNNKITANAMDAVACALCENTHLETLNIGSNPLGELGVQRLRPALGGNGSNLHRIGLQSTQMTCQSAILLAECLADNSTLIRVDLRDNPGIGSAGLLALHSAMKINCSISLLNLDQSCVVASNLKVRPYQEDFRRYYEDIKRYCERNKRAVQQKTENDPACENVSKPAKNEESSKESEAKQQEEVKPADSVATEADHSPSHGQALPSFSNGTTSSGNRGKFVRSSSLTCTETVADIHERLRVLGGSTHSLDEANTDSTKTIKKCSTSSHNALGLTEWGSLPAIPQASLAAKPVVRKLRRFSVSPSSSTFDVSKPLQASSAPIQEHPPRPKTLAVGIPGTSEGLPLSTVKTCSSLPDLVNSGSSALDARASDNKNTSVEKGSSADHSSAASTDKQDKEDSSSAAATEMKKSHRNSCSDGSTADADVEECSHQVLPCQPPSEDMMRDVRIVIGDLVNYVVYEETSRIERKRSLLLQTTSFPAGELVSVRAGTPEEVTPTRSFTPSRMVNIAEETAEESEQMIVSSVVRGMVREVLRREKEELRNTLDRRRKRSCVTPSNTPV